MITKIVLTNCATMRAASHLLSSERVLITLLQMRLFSSITIIAWAAEAARTENFMPQSSHIVFEIINLCYSYFSDTLEGNMRMPIKLKNSENIATKPSLNARSKR